MYAYMKKNERRIRIRRHIIIALAGILAAAAIIVVCGSHLRSHQVQASDIHTESTLYKSVYVNAGDTLWTIADTYMDESKYDKSAYIEEVMEMNHIYGNSLQNSLQAGTYIIVPYTAVN